MKHLGLFEGIGGFSLAAKWMGWKTLAWCEWNEFGQKVLKHHFPDAEGFGDITKTAFTKYANRIDIITGGFPCQPFSLAGKRKGTEDSRHLWPEMLRAIREVRPKWVVGENVYGIVNWSGGLVFEQVQIDLENEGYEVQSVILPACAKNAPHRRDRIWFIAYCNRDDERLLCRQQSKQPFKAYSVNSNNGSKGNAANSNGKRQSCKKYRETESGWFAKTSIPGDWSNFPTQSPVCSGNDGIPRELDSITIPKWRNESIKAYGNAIVPQVAFEIFKAIEKCTLLC